MAATVSPGISTFGRGRGRGRGIRAASAPQPPGASIPSQCTPSKSSTVVETNGTDPTKSKKATDTSVTVTTPAEKTHSAEVLKIMKKLDGLTESEVMTKILPEIEALQGQKVIEDLVQALSEKALCDTSFAVTAAKVAHKLWDNESMHSFVRNPLLKQTQAFYDSRETLRKENKYHGLCVYVCQLFKHLRVRQRPLLPIGKAVVNLLQGLIEKSGGPSNEDVMYFYQQLESVGSILGECAPEKLEEVINLARQMVISSTSLVPSVRCHLVQLIELHAAKWSMKDELKTLYIDLFRDLKLKES